MLAQSQTCVPPSADSRKIRVLSVVMLCALAALVGCGGSSTEDVPPADDTGTAETSDDTGGSETGDDTGGDDTGDDTGTAETSDDTGTAETSDDTGAAETSDDTAPDVPPDTDPGDTTVVDTAVDTGTDTAVVDTGVDAPVDTGPTVTCTSTTITTTGYTDNRVRVGAGAITFSATGTGLDAVTSATLGGTVVCTVGTKTATSASITCNVPHGFPLGAKDLVLNGGAATCTSAAIIEKITVNAAAAGAADTNVGTTTRPFRSVGRGLAVADIGDVVRIEPNGSGTYGTATGDTWIDMGGTNPFGALPNVKAGVTIEGNPAGGVRLSGPDGKIALRLGGFAAISNIELEGFRWGIVADTGTTNLTNVSIRNAARDGVAAQTTGSGSVTLNFTSTVAGTSTTDSKCTFRGNQFGLRLIGPNTKVTLSACDLTANLTTAAHVSAGAQLTTTNSRVRQNGAATGFGIAVPGGGTARVGLYLEGASQLSMTNGELVDSFDYGLFANGTATVSLSNVPVTNNGKGVGSAPNSGIVLFTGVGVTSFGSFTMTGGSIGSNGFNGLSVAGAWNATITRVPITGNAAVGLLWGSTGTLSARGLTITGNAIGTGSTHAQVHITDGANASTSIQFTADGGTNTSIARATPSTTIPLVLDQRGPVAGGGTIIQFATGSLFEGATMPAATHTGPTTVNNAAGNQRVFQITSTGRRIQVL